MSLSKTVPTAKPRILLVDDDRVTLALLASAVRNAGCEPLPAGSAAVALQLAAQSAPDLALLDVEMPGMSGLELAQHLRQAGGPPFLFLSSLDDAASVEHAIGLGALGYLVKPVDVRQIGPAVRAGLARGSELAQLRQPDPGARLLSPAALAAAASAALRSPVGRLRAQLGSIENYFDTLLRAFDQLAEAAAGDPLRHAAFQRVSDALDLPFLRRDLPSLLEESRDSLRQAARAVHDLQAFAHAGSEGEWTSVNLHRELDTVLDSLREQIGSRARVVKEYGSLPDMEGRPAEIRRVFHNLLANALAALADREHERSGRIVLRSGGGEGQVWVEVGDNGCGIAAEHLEAIFHPFFTCRPQGKGGGFGLAIAYAIARTHGGDISVSSSLGKGATFRVSLAQRRPRTLPVLAGV